MSKRTIKLKQLGKKKVHTIELQFETVPKTLGELLGACVESGVAAFNEKRENNKLLPFLSPSQIEEQSTSGKVGFGEINNNEKADVEKSLEEVYQAFLDGLFVVFIDEEEIKKLDQEIDLKEGVELTMIRLTFLTGRLW